jgi:hypothetical protein
VVLSLQNQWTAQSLGPICIFRLRVHVLYVPLSRLDWLTNTIRVIKLIISNDNGTGDPLLNL